MADVVVYNKLQVCCADWLHGVLSKKCKLDHICLNLAIFACGTATVRNFKFLSGLSYGVLTNKMQNYVKVGLDYVMSPTVISIALVPMIVFQKL